METDKSDNRSTGSVIREVIDSTKNLAEAEIVMIKTDLADTLNHLKHHSLQAGLFGGLLALSVIPFLAFLVIGLGKLINDRYWLSSLIISVICAVVGGSLAMRAVQRLKKDDLTLPHSRRGFDRELKVVQEEFNNLKNSTQRRTK